MNRVSLYERDKNRTAHVSNADSWLWRICSQYLLIVWGNDEFDSLAHKCPYGSEGLTVLAQYTHTQCEYNWQLSNKYSQSIAIIQLLLFNCRLMKSCWISYHGRYCLYTTVYVEIKKTSYLLVVDPKHSVTNDWAICSLLFLILFKSWPWKTCLSACICEPKKHFE